MEIWQMRNFIQICNDKSLTKAAKNLYISQQSLSNMVKNLEDEFQVMLFKRSFKGVTPTRYGETLLEKSLKIMNEYEEMLEIMNKKSAGKDKTLFIGIANMLYNHDLKALSLKFQEEHPEFTFEFLDLCYYTCVKYLEDGQADICFTLKPDRSDELEYIPISKYKLYLLINKHHKLSQKASVNIKDLKDENFIMLSTDSKIREIIYDYCLKSGFEPHIAISSVQIDIITELILLNKGIAILPDCSAKKALRLSCGVTMVPFDDPAFQIEAGFLYNKYKKQQSIAKALIDYIKKHYKK